MQEPAGTLNDKLEFVKSVWNSTESNKNGTQLAGNNNNLVSYSTLKLSSKITQLVIK